MMNDQEGRGEINDMLEGTAFQLALNANPEHLATWLFIFLQALEFELGRHKKAPDHPKEFEFALGWLIQIINDRLENGEWDVTI